MLKGVFAQSEGTEENPLLTGLVFACDEEDGYIGRDETAVYGAFRSTRFIVWIPRDCVAGLPLAGRPPS